MTPSFALEVDKGLGVSTRYACAGCKDHLSCPHIIKECECITEAGPVNPGLGNPGPGNPGPDLCSLQPGSIMLRECQASSPQKGAVGHLLLTCTSPEQGQCDVSASVQLWDSTGPLLM